jgi:hypothetical protein
MSDFNGLENAGHIYAIKERKITNPSVICR